MKRILDGVEIEMTESEIAEFEQSRVEPFNAEKFKQNLSAAFDTKFSTYCREKGYTDMNDLISHAANPYSPYRLEALSLIEWSHVNWKVAITGINDNSNIETIINNLPPYNG